VKDLDKWEDKMEELNSLSEEERQEQIDELKEICICPGCPTYAGTGEERVLFCSTGNSEIIEEMKGCVCGTCPNVRTMGLTRIYYCLRGSEADQRN
jgi:hypothetical protein